MVPSHRRALRARLLSFRHIDGISLNVSPCHVERPKSQSRGRGDPGLPCDAGPNQLEVVVAAVEPATATATVAIVTVTEVATARVAVPAEVIATVFARASGCKCRDQPAQPALTAMRADRIG